jgi:hypothetical protein
MKKIVLLLIGLLFLPVLATAYQVNIDAPESLTVGKPLVVTGETTFGVGTPIDVVLYYQLTTTTEVKRKIVYIQPDKTFKAIFDTTGLKTGLYKVEVPTNGMGGDSVTMRVIQLVDRTDSIHISSSLIQPYSGKMYIAGTITGGENSGIQVEVVGPGNEVIFGPRYVNTNYAGDFSVEVPVTETGEFEVSFTDSKGYIGAKTFTILGTPSVSESPALGITPATTPTVPVISAHAPSSRDRPAFFIVKPGTGLMSLYTSSSTDWVIEYVDENGAHHTVNAQGDQVAEKVALAGKGKTLYFKIYPQKASVMTEAFLYGQNVNAVTVSPNIPSVFTTQDTPVPAETQVATLIPLIGILAVGITLFLVKKGN